MLFIKNAIYVISSALEVMVLYHYFHQVLTNERKVKNIKFFASALCFILFTLVSIIIKSVSDYAAALNLLIVFAYPLITYKEKKLKTFLYSALIYIFGIVAEVIVGITLSALYNVGVQETIDNTYLFLQGMVFSKLLQFFILRIIGFFNIGKKIEIDTGSLIAVIIIPVTSIVSIYYFAMVAYLASNLISSVLLLCLTVMTILSNVATFYLLEKQAKLQIAKDKLFMMEKQYKMQKNYYSELKQNVISTNQNAHDLKNFAAALTAYLKNQKVDLAIAKIEEYFGKIAVLDKAATGNDAVDALIQTKLNDIKEEVPNNKISISLPETLNVDELDLCILIGNAVDNALEACRKIADVEKRYIEIRIFPINEQISISVKNSKISQVTKTKKSLKTTKTDTLKHGFGIDNMRAICLKYGGDLSIEQDENDFFLSALLLN